MTTGNNPTVCVISDLTERYSCNSVLPLGFSDLPSEYNMHIRYSHSTCSHNAVYGVYKLHALQLLQRVKVKCRLKAT